MGKIKIRSAFGVKGPPPQRGNAPCRLQETLKIKEALEGVNNKALENAQDFLDRGAFEASLWAEGPLCYDETA